MAELYSKFLFGEVYRRICDQIFERISDDIPPRTKILNMVIPIQMLFHSLVANMSVARRKQPHKAVRHPTKCNNINDVKLFPTVYRIFDVIQSDVA